MQTLMFNCLFKINAFRSALNPTELYFKKLHQCRTKNYFENLSLWVCVLFGAGYELFKKKCVLYVFIAKKKGGEGAGYFEESVSAKSQGSMWEWWQMEKWFVVPNNHQKVRLSVYQFSSAHTLFCGHRIHAADETTQWKKTSSWNNFLAIRQGA